ncbi:MAG: enoyl-CoA hydratase [Alphaproteobacteria bacterium]|nr:enoyl-CoA hydratase [Alphaproteobacteria bacterium]MCB9931191.1 enoyl-CoA hydratase [Alphaproteobacteria bacterium]
MALDNGGARDLLREDRGKVAILTMNRPEARNALSESLLSDLQTELDRIKDDESIHVVVLRGEGPGFCAGHDLKEMMANRSRAYYEWLLEKCTRVMESIKALPQPVIAAVHGIATAAGAQLAATCDMVIASQEARFATPGVNIGTWCSTPMVAVSRSAHQKAAMEMLLTGDLYDAEAAQRFGLVNRVVPATSLMDEALALAEKIAAKSRLVVSLGKEAFYRQGEMEQSDAYQYAAGVMTHNLLKDDASEGIKAFLQKRTPNWTNR